MNMELSYNNFEFGYLNDKGLEGDSKNYIRMDSFIKYDGNKCEIIFDIYMANAEGVTTQFRAFLFDEDKNLVKALSSATLIVVETVDGVTHFKRTESIVAYPTTKYIRFLLTQNREMNISDVTSVKIDSPYYWTMRNGEIINLLTPESTGGNMPKPYPKALWRIDSDYNNGIPYNELLPNIPITRKIGAFKDAERLMQAEIPYSVKKIGEYAFSGTQLKKVTIAEDCEYYPTSFPEDCEVYFYGGGGAYAPLADPDGAQLIDGECARIYVRSDE